MRIVQSVGISMGNALLTTGNGCLREIGNQRREIKIDYDLASVDIVSQKQAEGGGLAGAASGAALGFLIAGPIGTAVGAGIGRKKKSHANTMISVKFKDGRALILERVSERDIAFFQTWLIKSEAGNPNKLTDGRVLPTEVPTLIKGRSKKEAPSSSIEGPLFQVLDKISEGVASDVYRERLRAIIKEYRNFKWQYLDLDVEFEGEIIALGEMALSLLVRDNRAKIANPGKRIQLEEKIQRLKASIPELEKTYKEKKSVGYFKKVKENLAGTGEASAKDKLDKSLMQIKSAETQLRKLKPVESTGDAFDLIPDFEKAVSSAARSLLGQKIINRVLKKPVKKEPTKKEYFEIYISSARLNEERILSESTESREITSTGPVADELGDKKDIPAQGSGADPKERLEKLSMLFDGGLISEEEYSKKKQEIIGSL